MSNTSLQQGANTTQRRLQSVWNVLQVLSAKNRTNPELCKSLLPIRHPRRNCDSPHLRNRTCLTLRLLISTERLFTDGRGRKGLLLWSHMLREAVVPDTQKPRYKEADSWWEKFSPGHGPCQFRRLPEEHASCATLTTEGNVFL